MDNIEILTLVGGISRNSLNRKLFNSIKDLAPPQLVLRTFDISKLPYFSQDLEDDPPDSVIKFKDLIRETDAVLIITPEYNRSFPGVLKNALDWGSRPHGQNLWSKKPAGVMGATISNVGTFGAQHHLRQVLAYLNMSVMGQPEFYFTAKKSFNDEGKLTDEVTKDHIMHYLEALTNWVEKVGDQKITSTRIQLKDNLDRSPFPH
jgi:chromate reductase, NAD(P)H dehydrogenase (quinone)